MAIKAITLGITIAVFITSAFFTFANFFGGLKESIITGAVINPGQLASYSIIPLILSFIIGLFIIASFRKSNHDQ